MSPVARQIQHQPETLVSSAEVIYCSHQVHGLMERLGLARQRTSPTCQRRYAGPKCPIQAFYVCHMSLQCVLRLPQQQLNLFRGALNYTADDPYHPFLGDLFGAWTIQICSHSRRCGRPRLPVKIGVRNTFFIDETYAEKPSTQNSNPRYRAQRRTCSIRCVISFPSRWALTTPPSQRRVDT